jgi:hypothetical protein
MILYSQNLRNETIFEGTQVEKTKSYIVRDRQQRRQLDSFDSGYEPVTDFCKHFTKASDFIKTGGDNDYSVLSEKTIIREIITLNYLHY